VILACCALLTAFGITVMALAWNTATLRCDVTDCLLERGTLRGSSRAHLARADILGAELQRETSGEKFPPVRVVLKTAQGDVPLRETFSSLSAMQDRRTADSINIRLKKDDLFVSKQANSTSFAIGVVATLLGAGVGFVVALMTRKPRQ